MSTPRRLGPEQYLPRWTQAHASASGALYVMGQLLATQGSLAHTVLDEARAQALLSTLPLGLPRLRWTLPGAPSVGEVTASFTAGAYSGSLRRARSDYDFGAASDPVWRLTASGWELRNIHVRQTELTAANGAFTLTAETSGLVPDGELYWQHLDELEWRRLAPDAPQLRRSGASATFNPGVSGTIRVRYPSAAVAAALLSGTVQVIQAGQTAAALPLVLLPPQNAWDWHGIRLGVARLRLSSGDWEDNARLRQRVYTALGLPPDTALGLARGIALAFDRVTRLDWDGCNSRTLDTTEASGITTVLVAGVPRWVRWRERLYPEDPSTSLVFLASRANWRPGWVVRVAGVPTRGATLTTNRLTFTTAVSGEVLADYSTELWSVTQGVSGHALTLQPGTGLPSGSYQVYLVRGIQTHGLDLEAVVHDRLLTAAGLPNQRLLSVAERLRYQHPTLLSRAPWGAVAAWLDVQPETRHLPLPFDTHEN